MSRGNLIVVNGYVRNAERRRKAIRVWREEKGILQRELANQLGILRSTLSLIESGKRSPTPDQIDIMCAVFGCKRDQIAFRESSNHGKVGRPAGSHTRGKSGANYVVDENGKVYW